MGIVATSTSKGDSCRATQSMPIPREKLKRVSEVVKNKGVPIVQYIIPSKSICIIGNTLQTSIAIEIFVYIANWKHGFFVTFSIFFQETSS